MPLAKCLLFSFLIKHDAWSFPWDKQAGHEVVSEVTMWVGWLVSAPIATQHQIILIYVMIIFNLEKKQKMDFSHFWGVHWQVRENDHCPKNWKTEFCIVRSLFIFESHIICNIYHIRVIYLFIFALELRWKDCFQFSCMENLGMVMAHLVNQ